MYLFDLGKLPGQQSMLIFHALARMGIEALVIVSPKIPLVSIGYFQDAEQEVDLQYCRESKIPFMRREVGGGATYLDENQIFYQLIWKKDNPKFPRAIDEIYPWFSQAPVETYRAFGIETEFRVVNDIITKGGRKIAGEGGGNIGDCMVFVGGILLDFDYQAMSRILKVPDEKFRDKVYKTMEENLTTMKKELGIIPSREEVIKVLKEKFENKVGKLERRFLKSTDHRKNESVRILDDLRRISLEEDSRESQAGVKIREGVEVLYGLHKARGGLIRTAEEISEEKIEDITISGDFTFFPKEQLIGLRGIFRKGLL